MASPSFDVYRSASSPVKIAFAPMGDERWMAGEVIVRNILLAVRELAPPDVTLSLMTGSAPDERTRGKYAAADEFIVLSRPRRFRPGWVRDQFWRRIEEVDRSLDDTLEKHGVDVLFGMWLPLGSKRAATLSWLPDFQHVHMPEMFSAEERAGRDALFEKTSRVSTRLVLLSKAVQTDFRARLPHYVDKTRVLSPVTRVPASAYDSDPAEVARRYHLPEKFFYLPNQFWRHKNHELVLRAAKALKEAGRPVTIVLTGFPSDYRNLTVFTDLAEKISRWNLRSEIIYLGMIPHEDVLALVRQAICVLNPSRFEGWGISVDEARWLGKRVLASALPSHLEQEHPKAVYFDPSSEQELADHLAQIWSEATPGPDRELEAAARAGLPERQRQYGRDFLTLARDAHASARR